MSDEHISDQYDEDFPYPHLDPEEINDLPPNNDPIEEEPF